MKRSNLLQSGFILVIAGIFLSCGEQIKIFQTSGKKVEYPRIRKMHPDFNKRISRSIKIKVLASGFTWSEGPVWVPEMKTLLFSDVPENVIYSWSKRDGLKQYLKPSGSSSQKTTSSEPGSNGLLYVPGKGLIMCQHGDRRIAMMDAGLTTPLPQFITLADRFHGKAFNSPNDLCIKSNGDIYFTDPPYGLRGQENDPLKELDFQGVFLLRSDGIVELLIDSLSRPNGIALSPDERHLYVANSDPENAIWVRYTLDDQGRILSGSKFYDATSRVTPNSGLPDGLKTNAEGIIFATGPGGVWIFTPDSQLLGRIETGIPTANCAFDADEKRLFITADSLLLEVKF